MGKVKQSRTPGAGQDGRVARTPGNRGAGGRPTLEVARARDERLLAIATTLFETRGYDGTSMDAVAEGAGVGKPTVYARYRDKGELFAAVVRRRIETLLSPLAEEARAASRIETGPGDLAGALRRIGMGLLERALSSESIAFHRTVLTQVERIPALAQMTHEEGWSRTVAMVADTLRAHGASGGVENAAENANLFLSLVLGRLQRGAMLGLPTPSSAALERRVARSVSVFLDGVRPPRP